MTCYLSYEGVGCRKGCGCTVARPRGFAWEARFPNARLCMNRCGFESRQGDHVPVVKRTLTPRYERGIPGSTPGGDTRLS
jgi:hypothetical protein